MEKLKIDKKEIQVKDLLSGNLEVFHKLAVVGVKNINTAIDYLLIYDTYQKYDWIEKPAERKRVVSDVMNCHLNTIEKALQLMQQVVILK